MVASGPPDQVLHLIESMRLDHGGPVSVVTELARAQASRGMKVSVATNWSRLTSHDWETIEQRWIGLDVRRIDARRDSLKACISTSASGTVLHAHGVWDRRVVYGCRLAFRLGVPWIVSTHGMLHPRALAHHRWRKELFILATGRMTLNPKHLLVLNEAEAIEVRRRTGGLADILPNGVDPSNFTAGDGGLAFRRLCPGLGDRPYVLFVGRLHPIKGTDALIRAFGHARRQGLRADLVMAGPDEGARQLAYEAAKQSQVLEHVHFPGRVSGEVRSSAYSGCRVFAHRPVYEGFGLAVIEALASGKQVITTRRCELDGSGAGPFLTWAPDSDDGFGDALVQAVKLASDAPNTLAQDWVGRRYSWESIATQALSAYTRASQACAAC